MESPNGRAVGWDNERQVGLPYSMGFRQYGLLSRRRSPESYEFFPHEFLPQAQALGASEREAASYQGPRVATPVGRLSVFLSNKLQVNERQRVTDRKGPG